MRSRPVDTSPNRVLALRGYSERKVGEAWLATNGEAILDSGMERVVRARVPIGSLAFRYGPGTDEVARPQDGRRYLDALRFGLGSPPGVWAADGTCPSVAPRQLRLPFD